MPPFCPADTTPVPVTTTSTRMRVGGGSVVVTNATDCAIWVRFGGADVVAGNEGGMPLSALSVACLGVPPGATHLALVTDENPGGLVFVTVGEGTFASARWGNTVELEDDP